MWCLIVLIPDLCPFSYFTYSFYYLFKPLYITSILYRFVKDGVNYSINTDDPVVLGNTLTDDYQTVKEMGLTNQDIIRGVSVYFES